MLIPGFYKCGKEVVDFNMPTLEKMGPKFNFVVAWGENVEIIDVRLREAGGLHSLVYGCSVSKNCSGQ